MNAVLGSLGRWCSRHHKTVISIWVVVVAALLVLSNLFGGELVNDYSVPSSQSSTGKALLQKDFPSQSGYAGQIVFHAKKGAVSADTSAVNTAMANVAKLPHVISAASPFAAANSPQVAKDGSTAYGTTSWNVAPASLSTDYLADLDAAVAPARSAGLQVEYGAGAGQIGQQTHDGTSELIGLTCALLLLLLMFGSFVAGIMPLVTAVVSVLAGLSVVDLIASVTSLPTTAPTVATLLGLGVAIDYGLFLMARHREQLDHGMATEPSATRATATSGAAIVVAGGTVVVAILGLYVAGVPFVGALGLASAVVVAIAMIAALTLMPALMGLAGQHVRSVGHRRAERRQRRAAERDTEADGVLGGVVAGAPAGSSSDETHETSAFARWGRRVSDRPLPWAIATVCLLVVLSIPLFSMRLGQLDAGTNPTTDSSRRAYDLISQGFGPGTNGPLTVVMALPKDQSTQDNQNLVAQTQSTLSNQPGVAGVGAPSFNSAGTTAVMTVVPTTAPQDAATTTLVDHLRSSVLPSVPGKTYVVGTTASYVDFTAKISQRMPWLILIVVALAFVLLTVAFRSLVIPIKAAILNLLSVGAAYGVVVAVFQWGWGSSLVGIQETLPIPAFVPMLMFAIVFGLSMDYEVFLLSRVHEAWMATGDAHRSVAIGIGGTAKVITTAAAIMVVVFTSFVLDPDPTVKMLAVGMAVAVLVDASVIRMALVPAIMSLLGRAAWWMPTWLDRITPHLHLEEAPELPEIPLEHAGDREPVPSPAKPS